MQTPGSLGFKSSGQDVPLSVRRASEMLNVSVRTVQRMAERDELKASKVGKQWRISKRSVLSLLPESQSEE